MWREIMHPKFSLNLLRKGQQRGQTFLKIILIFRSNLIFWQQILVRSWQLCIPGTPNIFVSGCRSGILGPVREIVAD
jgi:hypothetical protein